MIDEEENKVERYREDGSEISQDSPWQPTGSEEELRIEIREPTVVTSILVKDEDEDKDITFTISFKPEDSNTYVDYVDESGQPQVSLFDNENIVFIHKQVYVVATLLMKMLMQRQYIRIYFHFLLH